MKEKLFGILVLLLVCCFFGLVLAAAYFDNKDAPKYPIDSEGATTDRAQIGVGISGQPGIKLGGSVYNVSTGKVEPGL